MAKNQAPQADEVDQLLALNKTTGTPSGGGRSGSAVDAFVREVRPIADAVSRELGVDPSYLIGQWGLETGWGKSVIPGTNNYGNIKDFRGGGKSAKDNMTGSVDKYRAYGSPDDFAKDYAQLLRGQRYSSAMGSKDAQSFFSALKAGGYAEDPNYVRSGVRAAEMARNAMGGSSSGASLYPTRGEYIGNTGKVMRDAERQAKSDESPLSTSIERGINSVGHNIGLFVDTLADDNEGAAERIKAKREWDEANPAPSSSTKFVEHWQKLAEDNYTGMAGAVLSNPSGMLNQLVEQTPNSLPGLALQIPVAIATTGLMATGWGAPLAIGLQGVASFVGNVLPEGGAVVEERLAKAGINPNDTQAVARWMAENRGANLEAGTKKAGVISAVDGVTGYMAGKLIAGPSAKFAQAEAKAFADAGIDASNKAARDAARATPTYKAAMAQPAQELMAATTKAQKFIRHAGGFAAESVGEGVGEYAGSYAAHGEASVKDAVLESLMGAGTSAAMTGAGSVMGAMKAPEMDRSALEALAATPVQPTIQPNSPLANAAGIAQAAAPQPAAVDPFDGRLSAVQSFVEDKAFIQALRGAQGYGPESVTEFLSAFVKARNPNLDPMVRERALSDLEGFIQGFSSRPNFVFGQNAQGRTQAPGQQVATVSPQGGAVTNPTQRDDGRTLNGEIITRPSTMAGANPNQISAPPVLGLPTEEALQAKRDADAAYEQAYQDLVKSESLGASDQDLAARQQAIREARAAREQADARMQEIERAIEGNRTQQTAEKRRAVLDAILADPATANPAARLAAELKRQGFRDTTPTQAELDTIQRFSDIKNAEVEPDIIPSSPNELDPYQARQERPQQPAKPRLTVEQIKQAIANGATLSKDVLTLPDGSRVKLKGPQIAAARQAILKKAQDGASNERPNAEVAPQAPESGSPVVQGSANAVDARAGAGAEPQDIMPAGVDSRVGQNAPDGNGGVAEPSTETFDVSTRTDDQLRYLAEKGKDGWREAAQAELAKRTPADVSLADEGKTTQAVEPEAENVDPLDKEISDAAAHLADVLADVFGAKLNITGPQHTAADLLPAMQKVIGLLIQKGFKTFSQAVGQTARMLRDNGAGDHVEKITPRQWKAAYQFAADMPGVEGAESEEAVAALSADKVQAIVSGHVDKARAEAEARTDPNPSEAPAQPAETPDVSTRTDDQLQYLANNGKPGWKEAAQAEMARREGAKPAEFEHRGVRIYPANVSIAGERKQMWGVESSANKAKREAGERHGFGDSLHETREQAIDAADRQIREDRERAEYDRRMEEIAAKKRADDAARKADTINGFLEGKAPNTQELIRKALDKQYRFDGTVMTVRERIESLRESDELVTDSFEEPKIKPMSRVQFNRASQREQDAHEKKMREAGTKTVYTVSGSELGKYAYDYAQHLLTRGTTGEVKAEIRSDLDAAAHEAATSPLNDTPQPTDGQKSAGNYKVGRVRVQGMDISIENPKGSVRSGTSPDGRKWESTLHAHYGYFTGTKAADGDHLDVYLTDGAEDAPMVWVIDQKNADGTFDEHKTLLGPRTEEEAKAAYLANYEPGWDGIGAISSMPIEAFKAWAFDGKKKRKPLAYVVPEVIATVESSPGSDAGNGFKHGPQAGERYRVGQVSSVGGAIALEKRLPAGTDATFYVGVDGILIDGDSLNLISNESRDRLWIPANSEQASQALHILDEMGRLALSDPRRAEMKRQLKSLVTNSAQPTQVPGESDPREAYANQKAEAYIAQRGGNAPPKAVEVVRIGARKEFDKAEAIHKDPGQPAEAVTPAVVAESIQKSARNTEFNPVEAKKWLLGEIDKAVANVPAENAELGVELARYKSAAYEKETTRQFGVKEFKARRNSNIDRLSKQIGFVTFDVPGDGKFKVMNTVDGLNAFRSKVEKSSGFKAPSNNPPVMERETDTGSYTPRDALVDGEFLNAYELARLQGKPLRFSVGKDHPNAYTDASDVDGLIPGFKTFVGRKADSSKMPWAVIEESTGLAIGDGGTSEAAAIAAAKAKMKGHEQAIADKLKRGGISDAKLQDQLEADWIKWAEEREGRKLEEAEDAAPAAEVETDWTAPPSSAVLRQMGEELAWVRQGDYLPAEMGAIRSNAVQKYLSENPLAKEKHDEAIALAWKEAQDKQKPIPEPTPLDFTPKQYHEARMKWVAQEYGLSDAEVRQDYDTPAARDADNQAWVDAVRQAFKDGTELTRATLDKLEELRPGALLSNLHDYPEARIPAGYQLPSARKAENEASAAKRESKKQIAASFAEGRAKREELTPSDLTNIFAGLSSRGLAKTRAQKAAQAHPRAEQIAYVQDNFMDILTELEDSGLVKINCD